MKAAFPGKTLIAAGLALTAVFMNAAAGLAQQQAPRNYGFAAPPACLTPQKERVEFQYYPAEAFAETGGMLAVSTRLKDAKRTPVVFVDRDNIQRYPQELQNFVLRHECAHHENGDEASQRGGGPSPQALQYLEDRADCTALWRLRREENYGDRQFGIIDRSLISIMRQTDATDGDIQRRRAAMGRCLGYRR
jgi:hypothetical protein